MGLFLRRWAEDRQAVLALDEAQELRILEDLARSCPHLRLLEEGKDTVSRLRNSSPRQIYRCRNRCKASTPNYPAKFKTE